MTDSLTNLFTSPFYWSIFAVWCAGVILGYWSEEIDRLKVIPRLLLKIVFSLPIIIVWDIWK